MNKEKIMDKIEISLLNLRVVREKTGTYDIDNASITSSGKLSEIAIKVLELDQRAEEVVCVVCCDSRHRINGIFEVFRGGMTESPVHPPEIFKRALLSNSPVMFLLHNHPGGSLHPSLPDQNVTQRLVDGAKILGMRILDHMIINDEGRYTSFKELGIMPE
jgi:DNA repair protein RadC